MGKEGTKRDRDTMEAELHQAGLPGQDLVMAGFMALSGTAVLAQGERKRLLERLPEELLRDVSDWHERLKAAWEQFADMDLTEMGASAWYPVGKGGVLDALWDMARQWDCGFSIQLKEMPLKQETIEICEILEINPYYLWSENSLFLAADHGNRLCDMLKKRGIPSAVVGILTDSNDRVLLHDETISYLNRPREDELERFLRAKVQL